MKNNNKNEKNSKKLSAKKVSFTSVNRSSVRIASAKNVILQEANALRELAGAFETPQFSKSFIDLLHAIDNAVAKNGRIVFVAVGKPSYIGRKIAATLSSLGTPAIFVHASEASHGDMGMITKNDIVVCMSNSGESREIFDVIDYCNKFKITLVAFTRNIDGRLAKRSDITLLIPSVPEACPMGKAPTTSTAQALALGDALSIVMSERTGMNPDKYKHFHPGGKLGASVMAIKEFYNPKNKPVVVKKVDLIDNVISAIKKVRTEGMLAIVDNKGLYVGYVLISDILNIIIDKKSKGDKNTTIDFNEFIKGDVCVELKTAVFDANLLMNDNNLLSCFIVKSQKPVGILFNTDLTKSVK